MESDEKNDGDRERFFSFRLTPNRLLQQRIRRIILYGSYDIILEEHPQIYSYTRTLGEEKLVVILNFSGEQPKFEMPEHVEFAAHELVISNYEVNAEEKIQSIELKPYEARVYRLLKLC